MVEIGMYLVDVKLIAGILTLCGASAWLSWEIRGALEDRRKRRQQEQVRGASRLRAVGGKDV